jgi:hypothetical protein
MTNNTELNVGILFQMYKFGVIQTAPKTPDFLKMNSTLLQSGKFLSTLSSTFHIHENLCESSLFERETMWVTTMSFSAPLRSL